MLLNRATSRTRRVWFSLFAPPRSGFSPAQLPGLALWLRADAIEGADDGDLIFRWPDSSGQGYTAQSPVGHAPRYAQHAQNGLPAVRFETAFSQYIESLYAPSGEISFFVACHWTDYNTPVHCPLGFLRDVYAVPPGDGGGVLLTIADGPPHNHLGLQTGVGGSWASGVSTEVAALSAGFQIIEGVIGSGSTRVSVVNGDDFTDGAHGAIAPGRAVTIGAYNASGNYAGFFDGDISEVIFYDRALVGGETEQVREYLRAKYGV